LFIAGAAMGLSLDALPRGAAGGDGARAARTYLRIARRTLVLFCLGLAANWVHAANLSELRIMGVLQRIALCYAFVALVLLGGPRRGQFAVAAGVLLAYWAALAWIAVPVGSDAGVFSANLASYLDRMLIGDAHLLRGTPYASQLDPEGLLSTLPAAVNVL